MRSPRRALPRRFRSSGPVGPAVRVGLASDIGPQAQVSDLGRHPGRILQARGRSLCKLKRAPGQSLSPPASDRSYGPPAPGLRPLRADPARGPCNARSRRCSHAAALARVQSPPSPSASFTSLKVPVRFPDGFRAVQKVGHQDRHAISVPLTPVIQGQPRLTGDTQIPSSSHATAVIPQICTQGVRGSSPLSSTQKHQVRRL